MDGEREKRKDFLVPADEIVAWHDRFVVKWHKEKIDLAGDGFLRRVLENHACNFHLWHIEDEARRKDVDDAYIAEQKRKIDYWNQKRNDEIERIDEWIVSLWPWVIENEDLPMNSETPGSIIDRLSIASLKIFHMRQETEREDVEEGHIVECRSKLEILQQQRSDLEIALAELFEDLRERRKRMRIYRQFKMYNDPRFNPALYRKQKGVILPI